MRSLGQKLVKTKRTAILLISKYLISHFHGERLQVSMHMCMSLHYAYNYTLVHIVFMLHMHISISRLDMIWTEYDNDGYVTLYAEDSPKTNTFNTRFHGFEMPPTTHYMRPFWLAVDQDKQSDGYCVGRCQVSI